MTIVGLAFMVVGASHFLSPDAWAEFWANYSRLPWRRRRYSHEPTKRSDRVRARIIGLVYLLGGLLFVLTGLGVL